MRKLILIIIFILLFCQTSALAETQNVDATCNALISKISDDKSSEYVFNNCVFDEANNRYVVSKMASKYRYYYYYSTKNELLGKISMLESKTNKEDVVFTATSPSNKVNYIFIANYYVVMSSRKVIFSPDSAIVYFPGGKNVTIHKGEVGKLNKNGTFELKHNNMFGSLFLKKYNIYGKRI